MKNNISNELVEENKMLKKQLNNLKKHKKNLDIQFQKIKKAKAYQMWQKFNDIKKIIKNPRNFLNFLPFEYKYKIKKIVNKIASQKEKRKLSKYFKYRDNKINYNDHHTKINKVSVVIPTKNAGPFFETILKKIKTQSHIEEVEIIIIDSESTDKTIDIAKKYGCKIISIKKEDFSHSKSRNLAAKNATGEYIIFTVQDALLLNKNTIYDAINFMSDYKVKVCTTRQIPRFDADVFSLWQTISYSKYLCPEKKDRIVNIEKTVFKKMNSHYKRLCCVIDDVFVLYKKDFFNLIGKYNEDYQYGEDLEIGKRIIEKGYPIAYLYSNGVIHSHNRSPSYFIKRIFVDSIFLQKVFKEKQQTYTYSHLKIDKLLISLTKLESIIFSISNKFVSKKLSTKIFHKNVKLESIGYIKSLIIDKYNFKKHNEIDAFLEKELYKFFNENLNQLKNNGYLSTIGFKEYIKLLDKIFAIFIGNHLSRYYISQSKTSQKNLKIFKILESQI